MKMGRNKNIPENSALDAKARTTLSFPESRDLGRKLSEKAVLEMVTLDKQSSQIRLITSLIPKLCSHGSSQTKARPFL